MSDLLEILGDALGVASGLLAAVAGFASVWLQILLHELAHAGVTLMLGGKVNAIDVGSGRFVWSRAIGATTVELRPFWSHGLMMGGFDSPGWWRTRTALMLLAGPVTSTLGAIALVFLLLDVDIEPRGSWSMTIPAFLLTATVSWSVAAVIAWLPFEIRLAGIEVASDVLALARMARFDRQKVELAAQEFQSTRRHHLAWRAFLEGDPGLARELLAGVAFAPGTEFARSMDRAIFTWPIDGPDAALAELSAAENSFGDADLSAPARRDYELALRVNRLFFLVRRDGDRAGGEAAAIAEQLGKQAKDVAVARTLGLYLLELGRLRPAITMLRGAWRQPDSVMGRALTALYLALAHASSGDARAARWFLQKARRLHALPSMLAEFEQRVAEAVAAAA